MDLFSEGGSHGAASGPFPGTSPSLLDGITVGIYSVDESGCCIQVNAAAVNLLGYTESECIGRNMHELIHYKYPDGSPYPIEDCPLVQRKGHRVAAYNIQQTIWRKDGTPIQVCCSSVPLFNNGTFQSTVITLNDIRPQREAEDRLQHAELQQREAMRQRDAAARIEQELVSEQANRHRDTAIAVERAAADELRQQQRMVEDRLMQSERLAAVGRLAASISHEINNPLEAVTNLLYLVRGDRSLSQEAMEYIRLAEEELSRVTEIVAQTLSFQRGSTTPMECTPESLVESVLALHQGRLHNSGIHIVRQHRRSRSFRCPEGDLRQVLNNLISNAIDAMHKTGGTITIRTQPARHHDSGLKGLRVTIADTGHGMSRATASQIFEPFYTTKGASGSGLGLWISSSIARRHGGSLGVRSSRDGNRRGTTFSLFLPEFENIAETGKTVQ
jgi:PAS domain S-box-containing protein